MEITEVIGVPLIVFMIFVAPTVGVHALQKQKQNW